MKKHAIVISSILMIQACLLLSGCSTVENPKGSDIDARWGQLHSGMTQKQVRALLGDPGAVVCVGPSVKYMYNFGDLHFQGATGNGANGGGSLDQWQRN